MKKYVTGFLFGALVAGATAAGAASIAAEHTPNVRYMFNYSESPKPAGFTTFMYQDRTYVPSRYLAEKLGAEVDWDDANQIVKIDNSKFTALTEQAGIVKHQLASEHVTVSDVTVQDGKTTISFVLSVDKEATYNAILEEAGKVATLAVKGKVIPDTVAVHMYAKMVEGFLNTSAYIPSNKIQQFAKGEITAQEYFASWKMIAGNQTVPFNPDAVTLNNAK